MERIAIIGGGPAGSMAAERLARAGLRVTLFEEKGAWEKPCGGGVTYKALRRYPFLLQTSDEHACVHNVELNAGNGSAVQLCTRHPLLIYSRFVLNRLLLRRAQEAGAEIVQERIQGFQREGNRWRLEIRGQKSLGEAPLHAGRPLSMPTSLQPSDLENSQREPPHPTAHGGHRLPQGGEGCGLGCFHARAANRVHTEDYPADYLILAAGARSQLRTLLAPPLGARDFMLTLGYYLPSKDRLLRIQFFEGFEGYAWSFPRTDHLDVGICGKAGESDMTGLRDRLRGFMKRFDYRAESGTVFSHLLPALSVESWNNLRIAGNGWALAGDVAGLVDPVTGEGIYFAMRSSELLAEALLDGEPESYPERVWQDFGKRLALGARLSRYFYHEDFLGKPSTTRLVEFSAQSAVFLELLQDLLDGSQSYDGLDGRLYQTLGRTFLEMAATSLVDGIRHTGKGKMGIERFEQLEI